ncbi:MAG TPA: hypothetical protein VGR28_01105 [Candidatus Thermoplasmatota archaeon]|jgi:hypothetical protein|nr:hypothetical protein [Candidatus Thermoplasmatota archaeon]
MFAQQHPIARIAEETVLNLKELETRCEVLKNDLAALCVNLGHPEAARLAVTPVALIDPRAQFAQATRTQALSGMPSSAIASPFGVSPFGNVSPWPTTAQGAGPSASGATPWIGSPQGYSSPYTAGVTPWVGAPQSFSPYAGISAYNPYTIGSYGSLASPFGSTLPSFAGTGFPNIR